jgi:K+-dependent Na+/Ca+ exchanger-like protein
MAVLSSLRLASLALLTLGVAEDVASQSMLTPLRVIEDRSAEEQELLDLEHAEPRRLSAGVSVLSMALGEIHCKEEFFAFDCHDNHLTEAIGLPGTIIDFLIAVFFMLYMFKGLGEICDSYFMDALEAISEALKLSPDVAGATFMAAGSSAPELFTSVVCTFFIPSNGGVGTIIGSAIFNIFVIVGATGTVACAGGKVLDIWWYPLTRDTVFYIMSILLLAFTLQPEYDADGNLAIEPTTGKGYAIISLPESCVMWGGYLVYIGFMVINPKIVAAIGGEPGADEEVEEVGDDPEKGEKKEETGKTENGETDAAKTPKLELPGSAAENGDKEVERTPSGTVIDPHHQQTLDQKPVRFSLSPRPSKEAEAPAESADAGNGKGEEKKEEEKKDEEKKEEEEEEDEPKSCLDRFDPISRFWEISMPGKEKYWLLFFVSVLWIMILSYVMVDAVDRMGKIVGIPIFVMALLFLAAGTSIPDALASIAVAKQGEGNMAISNALGSNIFDILLGLGVPWTLGIIIGKPAGAGEEESVPGWKAPMAPIVFDNEGLSTWLIILAIVVVVFFGVLIVFRWKLNVCVGRVMLSCYGIYVVYAIGNANMNAA